MTLHDLSLTEMQSINGGTDTSSQTGIGLQIGADSLLSLHYEWSQGNKHYESTLEVGKDIDANFSVLNTAIK